MFIGVLLLTADPILASAPVEQGQGATVIKRRLMEVTIADCSVRYPSIRGKLESQFSDWNKTNSDQIRASDEIVAALSTDRREALENHLKSSTENATTLISAAAQQGNGQEYCEGVILELSSENKTGYYDAKNHNEAIGMYDFLIVTEEYLVLKCIQIAPQARVEIESARARWLEREAKIRQFVKTRSKELIKQQPKFFEELQSQARAQIDTGFELLAKQGPQAAELYCQNEYFELAEDKKRLQTPKMYQFLEAAVR
jgi:hypothetical protein